MDRRNFIKLSAKAGLTIAFLRQSNLLYASGDYSKYDRQLGLIEAIRLNAKTLGLNLNEDFYKNWQSHVSNFMYYLYVSLPDKVEKPQEVDDYIYLGTDDFLALRKANEYNEKGYHTLIYKTAGSSVTNLTTVLLSYPMETISFIAFHEATHQHIRSKKEYMPYVFEEACCDVMGNYATIALANENKHLSRHKALKYARCIEEIDTCIIEHRKKFENKEYTSAKDLYDDCGDCIEKLIPHRNKFFHDRYIYEVNNAYFLRYKYYTEYYYLFKAVLIKKGIKDFVSFISTLPANEQLAKEQLIIACK